MVDALVPKQPVSPYQSMVLGLTRLKYRFMLVTIVAGLDVKVAVPWIFQDYPSTDGVIRWTKAVRKSKNRNPLLLFVEPNPSPTRNFNIVKARFFQLRNHWFRRVPMVRRILPRRDKVLGTCVVATRLEQNVLVRTGSQRDGIRNIAPSEPSTRTCTQPGLETGDLLLIVCVGCGPRSRRRHFLVLVHCCCGPKMQILSFVQWGCIS